MKPTDENLYQGKLICLTSVDPDKDAKVEARWTVDLDYAALLRRRPLRPLIAKEIKTLYEELEKRQEEHKSFHFAVRLLGNSEAESRLIGFVRIQDIIWSNGEGIVVVGISHLGISHLGISDLGANAPELYSRCQTEALAMIVRYGFSELSLFRQAAFIPTHNPQAMQLYEQAGFVPEVRMRQMVYHCGQYWDLIRYGLLRDEWTQQQEQQA